MMLGRSRRQLIKTKPKKEKKMKFIYTLKEVGLFYSGPMRNRILYYAEASYDTCKVKQVSNQCKNNEKVKVLD